MRDVLDLTLKKRWFDDMLYNGKDHEYREIKEYWIKRLEARHYDAVRFTNGYGKHRPSFIRELNNLSRGYGYCKWGAPEDKRVFILSLGKITEMRNIPDRKQEKL